MPRLEKVKDGKGRPTKLTDEVQTMICDLLRTGAYIETAAAYAGVSNSKLHEWLARGARELDRRRRHDEALAREREADKGRVRKIRIEERSRRKKRSQDHWVTKQKEQLYVDFREAVEQAIAESEAHDLAVITSAAQRGDWKAAAWKLERRSPKRWGKRTQLEVSTDSEGGPVAITVADAMRKAQERRAALPGANGSAGVPLPQEEDVVIEVKAVPVKRPNGKATTD